jgi:hypothetical protein
MTWTVVFAALVCQAARISHQREVAYYLRRAAVADLDDRCCHRIALVVLITCSSLLDTWKFPGVINARL